MANSAEHLEEVLSPFCAYGYVGDAHMVFQDREDRWLEEYEEHNVEVLLAEGGELVVPRTAGHGRAGVVRPDAIQDFGGVSAPLRELYLTFEDYVSVWYRQKVRPFGVVRNPNAKWDEWAVGEEPTAGLLLRAEGVSGCARRCHFARSTEIAWDEMRESHVSSALVKYDSIVSSIQALRSGGLLSELDRKRLHLLENIEVGGRAIDKYTREEWGCLVRNEALAEAFLDQNANWFDLKTLEGLRETGSTGLGYDEAFWQFVESLSDDQNIFLVQCYRDHTG